jgi:hypothetical protein
MPGLDPGIHVAGSRSGGMDCRVKPGNDDRCFRGRGTGDEEAVGVRRGLVLSSCPDLIRASTSRARATSAWIAGSSPAMTIGVFAGAALATKKLWG